jgi:hypothetical protein
VVWNVNREQLDVSDRRNLPSSRYDALPPGVVPRGLTREAAAAFVGLSPTAFDKARLEQKYPAPTLPGGRYDLVLLNMAMNRLSGILVESEAANPLDVWRASRGSRSA